VSVPDAGLTRDARYWLVPLARAVVALAVAVAITFNADHSAPVGFIAFGVFAIASGVVIGLGAFTMRVGTERSFFIAQGVIGVLAGAASIALVGAGTAFLLFIVSAWAAITGFLELYVGLRSRRRIAHGRDWLFAGALTAVFAIVVLLVPSGFEQAFTGPDKVDRVLTASVIIVGLIGAYSAILGVYLAIAALSLKWGTQHVEKTVAS
jgi:uncharacterized membrane protein HdeD (DUF308 family)